MGRDTRYERTGSFECGPVVHISSYPFISVHIGLYLAHICTYRWRRRRRGRARARRSPTAQSDAVIVGVAWRRIIEVVAKVW
jgi:hypothetical protein